MATTDVINPILDALVAAFTTITPGNGYLCDVTNGRVVRAPNVPDWKSVPRPYVGVMLEEETKIRPYAAGADGGAAFTYLIEGEVVVFVVGEPSLAGVAASDYAPEKAALMLMQDCLRAIVSDVNLAGYCRAGVIMPTTFTIVQDPNTGLALAGGQLTLAFSIETHT